MISLLETKDIKLDKKPRIIRDITDDISVFRKASKSVAMQWDAGIAGIVTENK